MRSVALGETVEVLSGFAFESKHFNTDSDGLPLIRIRDVKPAQSSTYYKGHYDNKFLIKNGDLLVGMDGEFNAKRWNGGEALLNQRVCRISASSKLLHEQYLYWYLPAALKKIEEKSNFVTVKHLSAKQIKDIEIPLPPLEEQKRIAAILDQADALRLQRQRALERLNQLDQSIFYEMFGDGLKNLAKLDTTLMDACEKITDGTHHSPQTHEKGTPYITAKHLKMHGLDFYSDPWFITESDHQPIYARCNPEKGDVLYIKDGATTGIAAINNYDFPFSMLSSLALLKVKRADVNSVYLCSWLNNVSVKSYMIGAMSGAGITRLTLTKIKKAKFYIPPINLQNAYAKKLAKIEAVKAYEQSSLLETNKLFSSLQHRAFRGEL